MTRFLKTENTLSHSTTGKTTLKTTNHTTTRKYFTAKFVAVKNLIRLIKETSEGSRDGFPRLYFIVPDQISRV